MEDYLAKFNNFELNVNELRSQLDQVSADRAQLIDTVASCEQSVCQLRKEKTAAVEERDSLMKVIERQQAELDRLKQDLHTYQQQLLWVGEDVPEHRSHLGAPAGGTDAGSLRGLRDLLLLHGILHGARLHSDGRVVRP